MPHETLGGLEFFFLIAISGMYIINSSVLFSKDYLSTCKDQATVNEPRFPFIALVVYAGMSPSLPQWQ